MPERPWSDTDRELVRAALPVDPEDEGSIVVDYTWHEDGPRRYTVPVLGDPYEVVDRVLDALTAAGKLARSRYAGEGEARCGEPHPDGGPPCQMWPGHDTHARPASGGSDLWKRETDE